MANLSISALAEQLHQSGNAVSSGGPTGNPLFEMLYDSYCRRNGIPGKYKELTDHHKACAQLYGWYANRYGTELKMSTGTKGQKRSVDCSSEDYTFDLLYSDDRQFKSYLRAPLPQSGNQDLLAFVLHTAVAFLVPLGELDEVLQALGFHPLHVKNIHHLSIAYVLLTAEKKAVAADYDPFAEVRRLYFRALELLAEDEPAEVEGYSYADLETRMIRDMLLLRKGLASQNFEALVTRNRAALNMRHSAILADFHKLSAVFIHLFDSSADCFETDEQFYSFYCFVEQFCRAGLSRKKFREELTSKIDRLQKHPTRNTLILLWLYTYCFAFVPGIIIDKTTFRRIKKQLAKTNKAWATEVEQYYADDLFDVYGFLLNSPGRSVERTFRGSDIRAFIDEKLVLRYGWGPLNDRLPFDHYIHQLDKLSLQIDYDGTCCYADFRGIPLTGLPKPVDNVPFPLATLFRIFEELAIIHIKKADKRKNSKLSAQPLKCSLYEQL